MTTNLSEAALVRYYTKDLEVLRDLLAELTTLAKDDGTVSVATVQGEIDIAEGLATAPAVGQTSLFFTGFFVNKLTAEFTKLKDEAVNPVSIEPKNYAKALVSRIRADFFPTRVQCRDFIKSLNPLKSVYDGETDPTSAEWVAYIATDEFLSLHSQWYARFVAARNGFLSANGLPVPSSGSPATVDSHMDTVASFAGIAVMAVGAGLLSAFA